MKVRSLAFIALLMFPSMAAAQADPCAVASAGPFTVSSGAPFTVTWLVPTTVPASATDPTPVPNRIDGFTVQVNNGVETDIGKATELPPCPASSPNAGKIPYSYRTVSGVSKGSYTFSVRAWNYVLDPVTFQPTNGKQGSAAVSIPFAAVDPVLLGPPPAPLNGIIKR